MKFIQLTTALREPIANQRIYLNIEHIVSFSHTKITKDIHSKPMEFEEAVRVETTKASFIVKETIEEILAKIDLLDENLIKHKSVA